MKTNIQKIESVIDPIDGVLSTLRKQFGEGSILRLGGTSALAVEVLPTGSTAVDLALGVGGLPRGRIVEVYGPEARARRHSACP